MIRFCNNSTPHPQTNGQAEISNREIKRILEKIVQPSRNQVAYKRSHSFNLSMLFQTFPSPSIPCLAKQYSTPSSSFLTQTNIFIKQKPWCHQNLVASMNKGAFHQSKSSYLYSLILYFTKPTQAAATLFPTP